MTAVSSLSSDLGMSTLLMLLTQKQSTTAQTKGPSEAQKAKFEQDLETSAQAAGLDISALSGLKDQIKTAVSNVIASYDSSGGTDGLKDAIKTAIEDTLKANGFDPSDVESRLQTAMKSMKDQMGSQGMGPPSDAGAVMGPPPGPGGQGQGQIGQMNDSQTSDQTLLSLLQNSSDTSSTSLFDFSNTLADMLFGLDIKA